jgi:peptidoglycan-associated lipoprotein
LLALTLVAAQAVAQPLPSSVPSGTKTAPLVLIHDDRTGLTFMPESIRYTLDAKNLALFKLVPKDRTLAELSISPGMHTVTVEVTYRGDSSVFSYLGKYRLKFRSRATVSPKEGEGVRLTTVVELSKDPTQLWENRLRFHFEGTPGKALLDQSNLPVVRQRAAAADGGDEDGDEPEVAPEQQAKDNAKAEETAQELLAEADQQSDSGCSAPNVSFGFGKFSLTEEAGRALAPLATCLAQHPTARLTVEGHCDLRGDKAYNQELGQWRAESVQRYLLDHGAVARQLKAVSFGADRPLCVDSTAECHRRNRRVQLTRSPSKAQASDATR